jgi:hypothetical protein
MALSTFLWMRSPIQLANISQKQYGLLRASRLVHTQVAHGKISMTSATLSPLVSEFETEEAEASYTTWLKAKVQASLDDPRPPVPHDQVVAEARALLASKRQVCAAD